MSSPFHDLAPANLTGMNPGTLLPPTARAVVYVITVGLAAAYAVLEASMSLHFGWQAGYAAWNAMVGALAVSNIGTQPPTG